MSSEVPMTPVKTHSKERFEKKRVFRLIRFITEKPRGGKKKKKNTKKFDKILSDAREEEEVVIGRGKVQKNKCLAS